MTTEDEAIEKLTAELNDLRSQIANADTRLYVAMQESSKDGGPYPYDLKRIERMRTEINALTVRFQRTTRVLVHYEREKQRVRTNRIAARKALNVRKVQ